MLVQALAHPPPKQHGGAVQARAALAKEGAEAGHPLLALHLLVCTGPVPELEVLRVVLLLGVGQILPALLAHQSLPPLLALEVWLALVAGLYVDDWSRGSLTV